MNFITYNMESGMRGFGLKLGAHNVLIYWYKMRPWLSYMNMATNSKWRL